MTDERWEQLRVQDKYTWFKAEQAEVTAYVEELRAQVAKLEEKLKYHERYGSTGASANVAVEYGQWTNFSCAKP